MRAPLRRFAQVAAPRRLLSAQTANGVGIMIYALATQAAATAAAPGHYNSTGLHGLVTAGGRQAPGRLVSRGGPGTGPSREP